MSRHQIIYTSCMRGIDGINDGQQVYSYDADFKDSKSQDVRSLFTYQTPALEIGVVMTEEIALTMPKAFIFRRLDNGTCAVTLDTYLGRDYMGSEGRFGNHLSHSLICDEAEYSCYPCELYGSEMLRQSMAYKEVNNPEKPNYLPTPELIRGDRVNLENVIEFLGEDDRIDVFKNMLHAMLSFESERKRLVICDESDNIVMWIAALEYALPLKLSLNLNFSTYEYDPSLSRSQICGVVPKGTKYNPERPESLQPHFVFDLYRKDTVDFNGKGEFYNFIEMAMKYSYDILKHFHEFLINSFSFDNVNLEYYNAYSLYKLRSDGISEIDQESFVNAISFEKKFADEEEKLALLKQLLDQSETISKFDNDYSLEVFRYVLDSYGFLSPSMQEQFRQVIVAKILESLIDTENSKEEFIYFNKTLKEMCLKAGFSIVSELMNDSNRQKIFLKQQDNLSNWKLVFICETFSGFVNENEISAEELGVERPLGKLYAGVVKLAYNNGNDGFFIVKVLLDEFSNNYEYLTNLAINVERVLLHISAGEPAIRAMWQYFCNITTKLHSKDQNAIFEILNDNNKIEQMYCLFESLLNTYQDPKEVEALLNDHYNSFVVKNKKYSEAYLPQILGAYYNNVKNREKDLYLIELHLLDLAIHQELNAPIVDELSANIVINIPLKSPSQTDRVIMKDIFFLYKHRMKDINEKALLIIVGTNIEKIKRNEDLKSLLGKLEKLNIDVNLSKLTEKEAKDYLEWIVPYITDSCRTSNELLRMRKIFNMSPSSSEMYITMCAKNYLEQSKEDENYKSFIIFLEYLLSHGKERELETTGKVLCKLSKKNLEILDNEVNAFFKKDNSKLFYWKVVKETASSTNPFFNTISNFLKRKNG